MKKNLITISSILLFSLLMFSGRQKETANTLVSEQVIATSKLASSESSKAALSETQIINNKMDGVDFHKKCEFNTLR